MGRIADEVNQIAVHSLSPDHQIHCLLKGRSTVAIQFRPGSYESYSESSLAQQLSQLATSVWAQYQRERNQILANADIKVISSPEDTASDVGRKFLQERDIIESFGEAVDGDIAILTMYGLRKWVFDIEAGVLEDLNEDMFVSECLAAVQAALADFNVQIHELKERCEAMAASYR